jgi:hypothetical protein
LFFRGGCYSTSVLNAPLHPSKRSTWDCTGVMEGCAQGLDIHVSRTGSVHDTSGCFKECTGHF